MYCKNCGEKVKDDTVFCPKCGQRLKEEPRTEPVETSGKTKTSAIVLSVLFGFFGWLYMYRKNAKKFWIVFSITALLLIFYGITYDLVIATLILPVIYLFNIGVFIWVIVDYATKPGEYYANYPN
jgi:uncharacterized membrane protein YvbJ